MPPYRFHARVRALWLAAVALVCVLFLIVTVDTAAGAGFGKRTMREGMSGSDVLRLQRYLTRAGYRTGADGQFGPRTERTVLRFERAEGLSVDGVVTRRDVLALKAAVREAKEQRAAGQTPVAGEKATLTSDGLAVPPASAPPEVVAVIEAGNEIATKPYKYGGGHQRWIDTGYDCSGSMSYALHGADLLDSPLDSTGFMRYGEPGRGTWITTYGNSGHSYMLVAGLRFDTSARRSTGSRWTDVMRRPRGYTVRHPSGF